MGLSNYFLRLALSYNSPSLSLPLSWDYRREPPALSLWFSFGSVWRWSLREQPVLGAGSPCDSGPWVSLSDAATWRGKVSSGRPVEVPRRQSFLQSGRRGPVVLSDVSEARQGSSTSSAPLRRSPRAISSLFPRAGRLCSSFMGLFGSLLCGSCSPGTGSSYCPTTAQLASCAAVPG
jgi:hypothetical protein